MKWKYEDKYSLDQRKKESTSILKHYEERIPIIVQKRSSLFWADKDVVFKKYLAPRELTLGEFYHQIRAKVNLRPEESLFFLVNDRQMPAASSTIGSIYKEFAEEDNFLYISYTEEAKFGWANYFLLYKHFNLK